MRLAIIIIGALLFDHVAAAQTAMCGTVDAAKQAASAQGGSWVDIDRHRWELARHIAVRHGLASPPLPASESAAVVTFGDQSKDYLIFVDGANASCPIENRFLIQGLGLN